jgi:hypothetical protein
LSVRVTPKFLTAFAIAICAVSHAAEEEAIMEEVIVEAPFDVRLELPKPSHVQIMIDRLTLKAETQRALDLQIANRTPINTLLDLTKYSPIPLGGSDPRVDTFFLPNYMRADLNPRDEDPFSLRR